MIRGEFKHFIFLFATNFPKQYALMNALLYKVFNDVNSSNMMLLMSNSESLFGPVLSTRLSRRNIFFPVKFILFALVYSLVTIVFK